MSERVIGLSGADNKPRSLYSAAGTRLGERRKKPAAPVGMTILLREDEVSFLEFAGGRRYENGIRLNFGRYVRIRKFKLTNTGKREGPATDGR